MPSPLRFSLLIWILAALAVAADQSAQGAESDIEPLLSASSDGHIWIVRQASSRGRLADRPELVQHALEMTGPHFSRTVTISQAPEAMAASGNRLWLVFPPRLVGEELRREVHTLQIVRDPAIGMYAPEPRDRLALVQSLPGWGRLAGFAAGSGGPAALLVPYQHEMANVQRDSRPPDEAGPTGPLLVQLRSGRWSDIPLPDSLSSYSQRQMLHIAFDGDGERLNLLTNSSIDDSSAVLHRLGRDGQWSRSQVAGLNPADVHSLAATGGRLAAVSLDADALTASLVYLRRQSVHLATIDVPDEPWAVLGVRDGFRLVMRHGERGLAMQRIGPIDGSISDVQVMSEHALPTGQLWHMGLMLAVAVTAILIVVLVRPGQRSVVQLPQDTAVLPPLPRFVAVLIDLVPGGVIAALVLGASPVELLRLPMMSETLEQAGPNLLMVGITAAHCTISELIGSTTLGKLLMGAGVASSSGTSMRFGQVLLRNLVKLLVLLVPPLAVFALLNPHMQGFNDIAAGTVVLRETAGEEKPAS